MALQFSTTLRNAMLDAITSAVGASGKLRIYSGSKPATVADAITGTLLADLTCNATFAAAASNGVLTLNAITSDSAADATGTATHFRLLTSGGAAVVQGDVGTSGSDFNLNATSLVTGATVACSSFTITAPGA
jgi:hypothetical protein